MTQKELLYVEDAIGHEKNVGAIVADVISQLQDKNLQTFLKSGFVADICTPRCPS